MLIVDDELPGLKIIQTSSYKRLIKSNPGFIHDNWGDFYSEVPVKELSDVIYEALDVEYNGHKANCDAVVVDASNFNQKTVEAKKEYHIKEPHGLRIYSPAIQETTLGDAKLTYFLYAMLFVESLFSKKQHGSLQTQFDDLKKMYEQMKQDKLI